MAIMTMPLGAQAPAEPVPVGPGVTAPRLVRKVAPEYSPEAQEHQVQGTTVLQAVIDEKGRVTDVAIISPLGFGLDELARAAVAKWEFTPGMKAGAPVKILTSVEVNFRIPKRSFDEKKERQRNDFNVALQTLYRPNASPADVDRAVQSMTGLCGSKYPPAMYVVGAWKMNGEHGPKDATGGFDLVQQAAAKNYGPALYDVAVRRIDGRDLPRDREKGLREMREAARLGSRHAQFHMGHLYETGDGAPRDLDRARQYFGFCAAYGAAACQYRLGRLLYDAPGRRERDYLQAVALFQLAAEQDLAEAKQLASSEIQKLTAEQSAWVAKLKQQIVRK